MLDDSNSFHLHRGSLRNPVESPIDHNDYVLFSEVMTIQMEEDREKQDLDRCVKSLKVVNYMLCRMK